MVHIRIMKLPTISPNLLFLIDGIGALISAFMLGGVLVYFQSFIGMPTKILHILAILPIFYSIFSFWNFRRKPKKWKLFLKGIAVANIFYCCLTSAILVVCAQKITALGCIYFITEILIILLLVTLEWKTASN